MTPAQKKERAAAEARKQAMLASGMTVAGLQGDKAEKRPFNKKKPAGKKVEGKKEEVKEEKKEPEPVPEAPASAPVEAPAKEESEDDWDKSEDEVEKVVAGVDKLKVDEESEDDWDKSSVDEPVAPSKSAAAPAPAAPPVPA